MFWRRCTEKAKNYAKMSISGWRNVRRRNFSAELDGDLNIRLIGGCVICSVRVLFLNTFTFTSTKFILWFFVLQYLANFGFSGTRTIYLGTVGTLLIKSSTLTSYWSCTFPYAVLFKQLSSSPFGTLKCRTRTYALYNSKWN